MKLCIFGSRNFADYKLLKEKVDKIHLETPISEIVSGKAKGADSLGEIWAKENNIPIKEFPADWLLGKKAGPLRNEEMAQYCDKAIGFSVNNSRGTANMCECLHKYGKFGWLVEVNDEA